MKKDTGITFRNLQRRELSPFMAEQLLYDYATKKIDPLREKAVADAVESSPELAKSLDDIIYGMTYCHQLQQTTIAPDFMAKFKAPPSLWKQWRRYRNIRHWNQVTVWIIEALLISGVILALSLFVPWPKYLKIFLAKQDPSFYVSETPKDKTFQPTTPPNSTAIALSPSYTTEGQLFSVDPEFTSNKLLLALPRLGASIEHQSMRKSMSGDVVPYFRISLPGNQTEALFKELNSQGQLTWITPPPENEMRSKIFGLELWIEKKEAPKGKLPVKDSQGE